MNRISNTATKRLLSIAFSAAALLVFASQGAYAAESEGLLIKTSLPSLPVITGVTQGIEIALPDGMPGGTFEAEVSTELGWGVLLLQAGPSGSGKVRVSNEAPARVEYRWSGAVPISAPVFETIKARIPELGLSGEISFNIGVDLRIKEISLPKIKPGVFNPVEIIIEDAFDPSLDIVDLIGKVGVKPEIAMSLSGSSGGAAAIEDPVIRAFFRETGTDGEQSYPGKNLVPGYVVNEDGKFLWRSGEDKPTGITPSSGGQFSIEATLKSNLGGPPLKYWSSLASGASGAVSRTESLPGLIGSAVGIMSILDPAVAADAEETVRNFLASGDTNGAVNALGAPLRKSFGTSYVASLGKFASALAESGRTEAEIINFLEAVIKGFEESGVLLFTRNGVAEWNLSSNTAAYDNARFVAVPFSSRQNITLTLIGSSTENVSLWKIIPAGTNVKNYEKGTWIKEITVFTAEVIPSH
ncbi:MAG: hypothetical protein FWE55_04085 [Synergistaceae bacterium]|nr:hypothetical protein [Synergistaceae bacterium]